MQYVDFKLDGKKVSRFGLGCMRLPKTTNEKGEEIIDEVEAIALIRKAIDNGVNYIDTAYLYPGSEVVVGKALKDGYREKVILATKLPMNLVNSEEDLQKLYEEEVTRLQVEHIDVYFLHNLYMSNWERVVKHNALDFVSKLKKEGKISYIAVSMHERYEHFEMVLDYFKWDLAMIQYNYYDKYYQAGYKGLHYASAKGIPVVSMESLHGGMLSTDVPKKVEDAFGDWKKDVSNAEKSFMWLYNQPEVTVILSGVSTMEQLDENLRIFEKAECNILSDEEEALYDKAREAWESFVNIECTACGYCMPCPKNVDIPTIFKVWNDYAKTPGQKWLYNLMMTQAGKDFTNCINCGKCSKMCPQKFDIPARLKEAHDILTS